MKMKAYMGKEQKGFYMTDIRFFYIQKNLTLALIIFQKRKGTLD